MASVEAMRAFDLARVDLVASPPTLDLPDRRDTHSTAVISTTTLCHRPRRRRCLLPRRRYGPTNNCVGIGDVLRERGHRVVFLVEESSAGTLERRASSSG